MIGKGTIAILGTLDTKGDEVEYMKGLLQGLGYLIIVVDVGALGPPATMPDIANDEVARWGGSELPTLLRTKERDRVMAAMGEGGYETPLVSLRAEENRWRHRFRRQPGVGRCIHGNEGTTLRLSEVPYLYRRLRKHPTLRGL